MLLWRDDADEYTWRFLDIEELDLDDEHGGDAAGAEGTWRGDAASVCAGPGGVAPQKAAIALLETMLHEVRRSGAGGGDGGIGGSAQQENTPPLLAAPAKKKSGKRGGAKRKAKMILDVAETAVLEALDVMVAAQVSIETPGGVPPGGLSRRAKEGEPTDLLLTGPGLAADAVRDAQPSTRAEMEITRCRRRTKC